jgi:hypothetical protein
MRDTVDRDCRQGRLMARPRAAHPRLQDLADAIALDEKGESGYVILVRVCEDDRVQASVPRG